jgi:hypothetical protein
MLDKLGASFFFIGICCLIAWGSVLLIWKGQDAATGGRPAERTKAGRARAQRAILIMWLVLSSLLFAFMLGQPDTPPPASPADGAGSLPAGG